LLVPLTFYIRALFPAGALLTAIAFFKIFAAVFFLFGTIGKNTQRTVILKEYDSAAFVCFCVLDHRSKLINPYYFFNTLKEVIFLSQILTV